MNKINFSLFFLCLLLSVQLQNSKAQVFINQAGYLPELQKIFYTPEAADSFYIAESSSGQIVFRGELYFSVSDDPATNLTL